MSAHRNRIVFAVLMAALPWLIPASFGPASNTPQWLISSGCAIAIWAVSFPRLSAPSALLTGLGGTLVLAVWLLHPGLSREALVLAAALALIGITASSVRDEGIGRAISLGILAAALISALMGLLQYFGFGAAFSPWVYPAEPGVAVANLRQTNQYASLCWLGFAVLLWPPVRIKRSTLLALAVLLSIASAAAVSRTGVLEGLLVTALAGAWPGPDRRQRLTVCAVGGLAYIAAALMLPSVLELATGVDADRTLWRRVSQGDGCFSRLVLWSNVVHLISLKPWSGWGWGELDYAHFMTLYPGVRFCDILDNAHNLPLHLAVELGLPVALIFLVACAGWLVMQRPWAENLPHRQLAWTLLGVILLHSFLEYPLWYGPFQIGLGAALGLLMPRQAREVRSHSAIAAALGPAIVALGGLGYAAWDYWRVSQIYFPPERRSARWSVDPLPHALRSWLFAKHAHFAELTMTDLTRDNAAWVHERAAEMLHYSPEPRVIERLIESASYAGRTGDLMLHLSRYRAAFPREYAAWLRKNGAFEGAPNSRLQD